MVYLGDEADNSLLAIMFLNHLLKRVSQRREDWDKQGKSKKSLDKLSKRAHNIIASLKKGGDDATELEEAQANNDNIKIASICARAVGSSAKELFYPFPQELTQKALVALLCRL